MRAVVSDAVLSQPGHNRRRVAHPECSVYIATSVDGFIAAPGGDIEWLLRPEYSQEDMKGLSYQDFIADIDAIVMGRHSFEKVITFDTWQYEGTPVIVLSSKAVAIPQHLTGSVRVESGKPEELVSRLAAEGLSRLYIDGGITIQRFLEARLIHEITITRIPILLGSGIPLFGSMGIEQPLRLIESVSSPNGFVQERYAVKS